MHKYSSFQVWLVLPLMGNILVESGLPGTCGILPPGLVPEFNPNLFATSCLPACSNCDETLFFMETFNAAQNSKVLSAPRSEKGIAPCEVLKFARKTDTCGKCDLSYVVLILAVKDGKKVVTGQGLRMRDGTILTIYVNIQYGTDIEVKFSCGATRKVKCIKSLKECSKNVLNVYIYLVRLDLEEYSCTDSCGCTDMGQDCCMYQGQGCCDDYCYAEPRFQTCNQYSPIFGCLMTPINGSTCFGLMPVPTYYIPDVTGTAASIALPEDPNKLTQGIIGGVFLTEDCKVLGIVTIKPLVAVQTLGTIPLANQVATACASLVLPVDCLED